MFSEWKAYEEEKAKGWKIEGEKITKDNKEGKLITYPILHQGKLYYARMYGKKTGAYEYWGFMEIVERRLSSGEEKVIVSFTGGMPHTPFSIKDDSLYYGLLEIEKGYESSPDGLGCVSKIYEKSLKTGKERLVLKDELRSFAPLSSDEILYAQDIKNGFGASFFLYSKKENKKRLLFTAPYLIAKILPTEEGIFVVARKNWENWSIYKLALTEATFTPLVDTPFDEGGIFFDQDTLYFTANYEKVYRVYAYNLKDKGLFRLTEEGYADSPIVDSEKNRLYFVGLTSSGNDIYSKELNLREFVIPKYERKPIPNFSTLEIKELGYKENLKTLCPKIHTPFPTGIYLAGGDAVGENQYVLKPYLKSSNEGQKEEARFGLEANICSTFFKPHIFSLGFEKDESIKIGWQYPLLMRLTPRLSILDVSLEAGYQDGLKERYIAPGIYTGLMFPRWGASLLTNYYVGSESSGLRSSLFTRRYIFNSHLSFLADYDYKKGIMPRTSETTVDNLLTLEYSFSLLKIRKGLWNPNIYFEDLCCLFFAEGGCKDSFFGGGVELKQEVSLLLGNMKFLHLGWGTNKNGEEVTYCGFEW